MVNYANGKIYCIRSYQTNDIYIGSTCQPLSRRMTDHRNDYKRYTEGNRKNSITSFDILKYGDAYIELIELYHCNQKCELLKREGEIIRDRKCVNKVVPGRTGKQYYQDNKDGIKQYYKQYCKQYYQNNKNKIKQKKNQYYHDNKQYWKQYYQNNKDKIEQKYKQKITCECGSVIRKRNKLLHLKTKKHKDFIENNKTD